MNAKVHADIPRRTGPLVTAALAVVVVVLSGCATNHDDMIAPAPERPWTVPNTATYSALAAGPTEAERSRSQDAGPPEIDEGKAYELADLIDIAQRTNPDTRVAWERARQAVLAVGIAESAYAPVLSAQAVAQAEVLPFPIPATVSSQGFFVADMQFFLPSLTLKWLLFDFGGKEATLSMKKEAVAAANFGFNATHQKIVFDVTRAYHAVNAALGRVEVARASLNQANTVRDAAESRRARGLATMPEVLQARERSARGTYELQEAIAGGSGARMALLAAMGVRPTTPLRVASLSGRPVPPMIKDTAEKLVDRALAQRPDLLAHVAVLRAHEADIRKAQSDFYPRISVNANVVQTIGRLRVSGVPGWASLNEPGYGIGISIEIPLFDGGLRKNRVAEAESKRRVAQEELELARDRTARQVLAAYEGLTLALGQREAAVELLAAANASYDAALDSYRSGVATLVDVTNSQTSLAKAQTADSETRGSVFTAIAALAFATGDGAPPKAR